MVLDRRSNKKKKRFGCSPESFGPTQIEGTTDGGWLGVSTGVCLNVGAVETTIQRKGGKKKEKKTTE